MGTLRPKLETGKTTLELTSKSTLGIQLNVAWHGGGRSVEMSLSMCKVVSKTVLSGLQGTMLETGELFLMSMGQELEEIL